jgi:hypothetical protein
MSFNLVAGQGLSVGAMKVISLLSKHSRKIKFKAEKDMEEEENMISIPNENGDKIDLWFDNRPK